MDYTEDIYDEEYGNLYNAIKEQNLDDFKNIFDNEGLDEVYSMGLEFHHLFSYSKNTDTTISIEMIKYVEQNKFSEVENISNKSYKIAELIDCDCINIFSFFLSRSKYSNDEEHILGFLHYASRETAYDCMIFILSRCSEETIQKIKK